MKRTSIPRLIGIGLAALCAVVLMVPLVWALSGSFHTNADLFANPFNWLPIPPHAQNYVTSWQRVNFSRLVLNSFFVGVVVSTCGVLLGLMSGYALAKRKFFGRNFMFWAIVATLLIPFPAIMVGVFLVAKSFGITNSYAGLIIPGILTGNIVFFMRQFLQGVPDDLIESARVDGAGEWRILWQIVMPLAWPVIISMGILTFVGSWNNLLWPLIVVNDKSLFTIPLGISELKSQYFVDYASTLAMSLLSIVPVIIVFLITRRRILDSIIVSGGAVKG